MPWTTDGWENVYLSQRVADSQCRCGRKSTSSPSLLVPLHLPSTTASTTASTMASAESTTVPMGATRKHNALPTTTTATARPSYLYLLLSSPANQPLDEPTIRLSFLTSLSNALGDHGAAIDVDILSVDRSMNSTIVRVPRSQAESFLMSIATGVGGGLRVVRRSEWLQGLQGDGQALFGL